MCRSTSSRCESHCLCSCSSEQNVSCWSAWWSWISVPGVGYLTPSSSLHHLFSIAGGHPAHAQRLCCASVIGASSLAPRSDIGWPCALAKGTSHCSCRTDGKCSPLRLKCWTVFTDIVRFICNHRVACGAPHFTGIALHHYTEAHHRAPHRTAQHQTTPQHTTAHHITPHHTTAPPRRRARNSAPHKGGWISAGELFVGRISPFRSVVKSPRREVVRSSAGAGVPYPPFFEVACVGGTFTVVHAQCNYLGVWP